MLLHSSESVQLLGALPQGAPFVEAFVFQSVGLLVVLLSLSSLWLLCETTSRLLIRIGAPRQISQNSNEVRGGDTRTEAIATADEITAVIAAAVVATSGRGSIIREIQPVAPSLSNPQLAAWTLQGRLQHHTSHSLR